MGSLDRYSRLVVREKLGELESPGASVADVRAYVDGLVRDLLSPEGRQVVGKANPGEEVLPHRGRRG